MKVAEQGVLPVALQQFRMARLQLFNWGTFSGIHTIPVAKRGFLVVGPSGAGKSTLLDAFTALLIPPRWAHFNEAARDVGGRDRNLVTYIRGAWAEQQDGDSGDIVKRYLRTGTTWSALVVTFENDAGQFVSLAQLMWIRGSTNASTDVRRLYLILECDFDIRELQDFGDSNFDVRKLKQSLPAAVVRDEFKPYSERFCSLLGIENEMALRLLHKTQSAKSLGDLNSLLRDFMLERPETFSVAERLVSEFGELNSAHSAVVIARKQVATLLPAREAFDRMESHKRDKNALQELRQGVKPYRVMRRVRLLEESIRALQNEIQGKAGEIHRNQEVYNNHVAHMEDLESQHKALGGDAIEQWEAEKRNIAELRLQRGRKRTQAEEACKHLGQSLPDSPQGFADLVQTARTEIERRQEGADQSREQWAALDRRKKEAESAFSEAMTEVNSLKEQRSNIPANMLALRNMVAAAIKVDESALPFVGELIEVRKAELPWQGAIERVLRGFALSLLVNDDHYADLVEHLNKTNLKSRLSYYRTEPRLTSQPRSLSADSLALKLSIQEGPFSDWLRAEIHQRFDLHCVDSLEAFRQSDRAVTREGQIKHNRIRHEKDDQRDVSDRKHWILGFDNSEKRALFEERARELARAVSEIGREISNFRDHETSVQDRLMHCQTLVNLQWQEIDLIPLIERVKAIDQKIEEAKRGNVPLKKISDQIDRHRPIVARALKALNDAISERTEFEKTEQRHKEELEKIATDASVVAPTPFQIEGLDKRFAALPNAARLENLDALASDVSDALAEEVMAMGNAISDCEKIIENRFTEFKNMWPADAGDMDTTIASASDYFAKLKRLETDGLPAYEQRFFELLNSQSHQNLAALARYLSQARKEILERMDTVNQSLAKAPFNVGTFLQIDANDRQLEAVRDFKREIQEAISHALSDDREAAEARFIALKRLVDRLASQEPEHTRWRDLVLDVRQHVDFVGRETDTEGKEVEIYRSGAGKSGGQRQKLATTCLAAALRYQLGGADHGVPIYAAVVLDEAFDKADNEFTALAMNIFVEFGFQMIVATPLKSVMTLEPFIGGACFVQIADRRTSGVLLIEYDMEHKKLRLNQQARDVTTLESS
jgi:uncharacterized protein YPO0396